ncbi:MAG: sigma 54-interacting transcriptional regulator [Candidatus Brocadiaceae bacterium]|nr:sigma 54-interacting transcriptional regulator [Candidatus Brocadiaceae bacterium]
MKKKKDSVQKWLVPHNGNKAGIQSCLLASNGNIDKSIIDNLDSDVILLDKELNIVLMNKAAEQTCGVSFQEVKGTSYLTLRLKSIEQKLVKNLHNVLETKKTLNIKELQLISPDNVTRFFDQSCIPVFDNDGLLQGVLSISREVTKRVNKEIQYQESQRMLRQLSQELYRKNDTIQSLQTALKERFSFHNLIGKSYVMRNIYNLIERVSQTDSTILITGETGTGKELVARAIHYNSLRKNYPMVTVNCAALPETLLESELFGHVKGSFTGAIRDKKGKFELADKGTIFLDEIGELSTLTQVKLLRVLQERQVERVGDEKHVKVDIRIIAATNQDLLELIEKGKFRKDLFYRLNIISIRLPSLKERTDDIPLLVNHFIEKFNNRFKKKISGVSSYVLRKLMSYSWPGNIRELEGVMEKAVLLEESETIKYIELLTDHSRGVNLCLPPPLSVAKPDISSYDDIQAHLDQLEKEYFIKVFQKYRGRIGEIAKFTGLNRRTILNKMKKFSIKKDLFKQT